MLETWVHYDLISNEELYNLCLTFLTMAHENVASVSTPGLQPPHLFLRIDYDVDYDPSFREQRSTGKSIEGTKLKTIATPLQGLFSVIYLSFINKKGWLLDRTVQANRKTRFP